MVSGTKKGWNDSTQMLQYQTRAGILPNPCNCGFFVNEGLQRISLYVKSRFCLETHAANSQRCRCKAFSVPPPGFDIVFLQLADLLIHPFFPWFLVRLIPGVLAGADPSEK